MLHFLHPWALVLLPLPLLAWRLLPVQQPAAGLQVPQQIAQTLQAVTRASTQAPLYRRARLWLALIGWVALVGAIAAPLSSGVPVQFASGRDLLLVIDLSASMKAKDVQLDGRLVDRFSAVKSLADEFIRGRAGDRVGIIVFADEPYLLAPLSYDVTAIGGFLNEVQVGLPGRKTAVGDAVGLAVKTLEQQPIAARVIVLLSDGDGNAGLLSPELAAEFAVNHQVRIHTIGFAGSTGSTRKGDSAAVGDAAAGKPTVAAAAAEAAARSTTLQVIARATGGRHYTATSTRALQRVYTQLDQLEATRSQARGQRVERDWVHELILLVVMSLTLLCGLEIRRGGL